MKTKVMFPHRIDGKIDLMCPFAGWRFNNLDEFKTLIKKYFSKETGYPGLYFKMTNGETLVFVGHQYEVGPNGERWSLVDTKTEDKPSRWFKLDESLLEGFQDAEQCDAEIKMMGAIINAQGGIYVTIDR